MLCACQTEAEWESAAAYDAQMQRHPYPWGDDEPTLEHAIYRVSHLDRSAPRGSAYGARTMRCAGYGWQCVGMDRSKLDTCVVLEHMPVTGLQPTEWVVLEGAQVPLRGGRRIAYDSRSLMCGAQQRTTPAAISTLAFDW